MSLEDVIFLISSIGSLQSLLIGIYFLALKKEGKGSYQVLGSLLIVLGIRVGKSALYLFAPDTSQVVFNIGFVAHAAAAPLLMLYIQYYPDRKISNYGWLHLLPALILLMGCGFWTLDNLWYVGGYTGLLYYSTGYILSVVILLIKKYNGYQSIEKTWLMGLTFGVSVLLMAYFTNYILGWTSYVLGPLMYAVLIYAISYFVLINHSWFLKPAGKTKYKYLNISSEQAIQFTHKIQRVLYEEKAYLDPSFNLSALAQRTAIPSYILSHIFSDWIQQKFIDYVNEHRINDAKDKLKDHSFAHLKISSIAYDCGFNSLSAFNQAFKKFTAATPSQYRHS